MADVFEILADPTRRRLVEALRAGERSVSELVDVVDISQPGVSRQLAILEEARFVRVRPDGRRRLYALRPEPFREIDEWMNRYRGLWEARLDRFAAELDRRKKARARDRGRRA
jgi:DNA-binding transcriptional ArsR family regulator